MRPVCKRRTFRSDKSKMILSLDTSNYTTSACLFDSEKGIVWQNRILLHPPKNQRGLRQSDVVFLHTKNLEVLFEGVPKNIQINGIAVSEKPRPIENSYMPCFLVGKNFAKSLSHVLDCGFKTYSHQENHIMAAVYSSGHMKLLEDQFIAFHISGGTSDVLKVTPGKNGIDVLQIGNSLDLHAGQLIDRIGVLLGLEFPCGIEIEKLSAKSTRSLPIKTSVTGFDFHFSGFENQAQKLIADKTDIATVAKFSLDCVLKTIDKVLMNLRQRYGNISILFAGGVMSNRYIASELLGKYSNIYFSDPFYSSDHALGNAVMYSVYESK